MSFSSALSNPSYNEPPDLDHIVHLVRPGKLQTCASLFEKLGFNVEMGGVHADGLTQNALIYLKDGVYLELIEFLEKPVKNSSIKESIHDWRARRERHWWWGKKDGWIDWCLKGGIRDNRVSSINEASKVVMQSDSEEMEPLRPDLVQYQDSIPGGRKAALDGKDMKWNVTFPAGPTSLRGRYPFWCEDMTPREWRVKSAPKHPNLSQGLAALTLLYYPETFPSRLASLQIILSSSKGNIEEMRAGLIDLDPPPITEGTIALPTDSVELYLSTPEGPLLPLRVKAAEDPDEREWLDKYGEGLWEVEISVASDKLPPTAPPDGVERLSHALGYGRLRLHPIRGLTKAFSRDILQ